MHLMKYQSLCCTSLFRVFNFEPPFCEAIACVQISTTIPWANRMRLNLNRLQWANGMCSLEVGTVGRMTRPAGRAQNRYSSEW
jgi:hypothetical protein